MVLMQTCNGSNIAPAAEGFYDNAKILMQEYSSGRMSPHGLRLSGGPESRRAGNLRVLNLGCFSQPAHPSLDEAFLVSLVDGYERPGKLIGVQPRGYSCGGVR